MSELHVIIQIPQCSYKKKSPVDINSLKHTHIKALNPNSIGPHYPANPINFFRDIVTALTCTRIRAHNAEIDRAESIGETR